MKAKQFFKSNVFKCLITLLCVLLVCGAFLTIMNGLLEVTSEERLNRVISKIYGTNVEVDKLETKDYNENAEIKEAYKVKSDGNYLIKATGKGGYQGGTVTCWTVVLVENNAVKGVDKVVIDGNEKQTLMSQFTNSVLNQFSQKYDPDNPYSSSVITGASAILTKNAICNSVNAAIDYVKAQFGEVWVNPYEDFDFVKYIDEKQTKYEVKADKSVEYKIVTKGYGEASAFNISIIVKDGKITAYEITNNGSTGGYEEFMPPKVLDGTMFIGKDSAYFTALYGAEMDYKPVESYDNNNVTTGATNEGIASNSTYLCMYAGAFATANYQRCLDIEAQKPIVYDFVKYIDEKKTTYTVTAEGVEFEIVTKGYGMAEPFKIAVTVKDGKITAYQIISNGSTSGYEEFMPPKVADGTMFIGKELAFFTGIYGAEMGYQAITGSDDNNVTTGATDEGISSNSTYLCMYAGAFATANYQKCIDKEAQKPPVGGEQQPEGGANNE